MNFILSNLHTATFKQVSLTFSTTVINGVLGMLFYVIMARDLGPDNFGSLMIAITSLTLMIDILDLGTNTGLVKLVSENLYKDRGIALSILKLSLIIKLLVWIVSIGVGYLIMPFVSQYIFHKVELTDLLRLSLIGVGSGLLISYSTSALQAFEKFWWWSWINITSNSVRLILVFILIYLNIFEPKSSLLIYILVPFTGFFISLFLIPVKQIINASISNQTISLVWRYNGWVALFTLIAAISARLDTFLVARFLTAQQTGYYSAANLLVVVIPQLVTALGVVIAPKFARFSSASEMWKYFKKIQLLVLIIFIGGVVFMPLFPLIIKIIYGENYLSATSSFVILTLAMLIFLISVPIHNAIFYYYGKPKVFVWLGLIHLIVIGGLGYYLIQNYNILGASVAVLVGMIVNLILPWLWVYFYGDKK